MNIIKFNINYKFHIICASNDVINHLLSPEDMNSCFKSISDHLDKNGYFIFDLTTQKGSNKSKGISYGVINMKIIIQERFMKDDVGFTQIEIIDKNKKTNYKILILEKGFPLIDLFYYLKTNCFEQIRLFDEKGDLFYIGSISNITKSKILKWENHEKIIFEVKKQ